MLMPRRSLSGTSFSDADVAAHADAADTDLPVPQRRRWSSTLCTAAMSLRKKIIRTHFRFDDAQDQ
jgi:hypothetical protein